MNKQIDTQLQLKFNPKNAQLLCPKGHKIKCITINNDNLLYCKKCSQFYPLPGFKELKNE